MTNNVAYRAGSGTLANGRTAAGSALPAKYQGYFSDLDNDGNNDDTDQNTVYATRDTQFSLLVNSEAGFFKYVKAADTAYSKSPESSPTEVPATGTYTYQLRFQNDGVSGNITDLVFYDVLETAHGSNPSWQGTLVSIDNSYAATKGVAPVVYYSTVSDIVNDRACNKASYRAQLASGTLSVESNVTAVSLREPDIEIQKIANPASGTELAPTYVSAGSTINYDVSLTNTNTGGEAITDIKFTDTIPTGLTVDLSEIKFYFGTNPSSAALVDGNTSGVSVSRASGSSQKLEFTVDKLAATQTVHFIIPAVVGSGIQGMIKNTAIITELNEYSGFDIKSDPTYHKVSPVLRLTGTKTMTGRTLTAADVFTFTVKEGSTIVATGANNGTGTITFTPIVYTAAGTHTYTVTEDPTPMTPPAPRL